MKAFIFLLALILIVGCTGNIEDTIKNLPAIESFLEAHPDANLRMALLDKEYVSTNLEDFKVKCGPQFQAAAYYYAIVEEQGQKVEAYIEKESGEAVCVLRTTSRTDDGGKGCTKEYDPVCSSDGTTYGNKCLAELNEAKVVSEGECNVAKTCPEEKELVCGSDGNTYRNSCVAEQSGVKVVSKGACESVPPVKMCTREYAPVCGSDGKTYSNKCVADAAGAKPIYEGECRPIVCPDDAPGVCGVDGKTYPNACYAHVAGVKVAYEGVCKAEQSITAEQAVAMVKENFRETRHKYDCSEPSQVSFKEKRDRGYAVQLVAKCGKFIPVTTKFEMIVAYDGSTIISGGVISRDIEACRSKGGVWNECPMAACPEGLGCIQVCEEPRCEYPTTKLRITESEAKQIVLDYFNRQASGNSNACSVYSVDQQRHYPSNIYQKNADETGYWIMVVTDCSWIPPENKETLYLVTYEGVLSSSTSGGGSGSANTCEKIGVGCNVDLSKCSEDQKADYWKGKDVLKGSIDKSYYLDTSGYVCNIDFGTFTQAWPVKAESEWWCGNVAC